MLPLAFLGIGALIFAAVKLSAGPNLAKIAVGLNMPLTYVASAQKWARHYSLPLEWVLATILVESSGNWKATGDANGRSIGLMQVNSVAHAKELQAAGVSVEDLFMPDRNIEWGVKYLREFRDDVIKALGGRTPPAALDEIVRLAYKGPETVYKSLRAGHNPLDLSWAPAAIANWRRRMTQVKALV